ncbi:MAG: metalloprotease PmbA [Gammaproteobacteria bacterium]|nr:metalloprotease PmbA [Gammaproteobacteria bacterium]MCW8986143.1 metalloprotease PmbA [Gammaproteobacteria bacterium]MCW9030934.1 metalloprotease PmbA [Gammaproteobacteria bacterium]
MSSQNSSSKNTDASNPYDSENLKSVVNDLLQEATAQGASAAEAGLSVESGLSVTVRMGEVETMEHNRDKGLAITVYFGQRKGSASTSDFSPKAIKDTVKAACDIARYTEDDIYAGLPDEHLMAKDIADLDLYHPWEISAEEAMQLARQCEDAARAEDNRILNSEGGSVSSHSGIRVYGNTQGFLNGYPTSRHSMSCTVIAGQNEAMQRDYWYSVNRDASKLESAVDIGKQAAQRTVSRLDAKSMPTCKVPVIFKAEVARGLLSHFLAGIRGGAQYRKASFLLDHLGKQIFPENIRLDERPHIKGALSSAPYDSEGVMTRAHDIITDGVLQSYVLDSYAARRLDMQSTGNAGGIHNLYINHDDVSLEAMLKEMDKGLLITEVMGQGVNTVTGDYSRGATGFWVENGEIQYPVEEFTLASRLQDMFMGLQRVGNDLDTRAGVITGSWLIDNMTVAGS